MFNVPLEIETQNNTSQRNEQWQGLPYFPISALYKKRFGTRVYKIPVSTAHTCPNREGLKGMKTCIFCDQWGSAAYPELREQKLRDQILESKRRVQKRTKANRFMVYFQAYTNTFAKTADLRRQFEIASEFDDVVGFVVGTRPDCMSDAVIELWQEYQAKTFMAIEFGAQSFNNEQLKWMERGHTAEQTIKAIYKLRERLPTIDIGIHLMFGLPGETDEQLIETAMLVSELPIQNVKLHNLHVLKKTPLELIFGDGKFQPIDLEEYTRRVMLFLKYLSPKIAVHRLSALASRSDELVAPHWVNKKMEVYQYMLNAFQNAGVSQGMSFTPSPTRSSLPLTSISSGISTIAP